MKDKKTLVLIPARYASTRFPGKPLCKILDKTMIEHVYSGCANIETDFPGSRVAVVTDDQRIEDEVKSFGGNVVRIDDDVPSGSERIKLAYERYFKNDHFDYVINVQGDEPLIQAKVLEGIVNFQAQNNYDVATVVKKFSSSLPGYNDPNKVKAIYCERTGKCHYFTRSAFPHNRDAQEDVHWFLHVGIYSFKPEVLLDFCELDQSKNEKIECLEQLRLLDNNYSIGAIVTDMHLCGVDSPDDIAEVEGAMNGN